MISAVIIDDELPNTTVLKTLLTRHCPTIQIASEADSATLAYDRIEQHRPQLIFLDVKMPNETGFDLLRRFESIEFEVIFVSAFNEFVLGAFEFNAVDYILKPIDHDKLIKAVARAESRILSKEKNTKVMDFLQTLDETDDAIAKIAVHDRGKVVLIPYGEICHLVADGDSTTLYLIDKKKYQTSRSLGQYEQVLCKLSDFVRINKSVMINIRHLVSYSKGDFCLVSLSNGAEFEVSRRKKTEVLSRLHSI